MRRTTAEFAVAIAAGAMTWVIFEIVTDWSSAAKLVVAVVVTILGLGIAISLRRGNPEDVAREVTVGDQVRAGEDISLRGVKVRSDADVRVATRLRAAGSVNVDGVNVDQDSSQ